MAIGDVNSVPLPPRRPVEAKIPEQQQPANPPAAPAAEKDYYSNVKANTVFAKPNNKAYAEGGEDLKRVQSDLFNAGFYKGSTYNKEVDGKIGARTQAALQDAQTVMKKAGYYNGPINGQFNADMARGIAQLRKAETLPGNLTPDETQKVKKLGLAADQKPQPMQPAPGESTYVDPAKSKVDLQGGPQAPATDGANTPLDAEKVRTGLTNLLNKMNDPDHVFKTEQERTDAASKLAGQIADLPDSVGFLKGFGEKELGFKMPDAKDAEDAKRLETGVDNYMRNLAGALNEKSKMLQQGVAPATADAAIQRMMNPAVAAPAQPATTQNPNVSPENVATMRKLAETVWPRSANMSPHDYANLLTTGAQFFKVSPDKFNTMTKQNLPDDQVRAIADELMRQLQSSRNAPAQPAQPPPPRLPTPGAQLT